LADRYCRNCGYELAETDSFCPNCGRPVHETANVLTPEADASGPPPSAPAHSPSPSPYSRPLTRPVDLLIDALIVVIGFPGWLLLIATAIASSKASSAYEAGYMAGGDMIEYFVPYGAGAALLTFLTLRWSRYKRKKQLHEAEVHEAQEQFFLDTARKRERENDEAGRN
jgi:hypothetical protein